MILSYTLSMPSNNSWNGKWSGEGRCFARVRSYGRSKKQNEKASEILKIGYFTYSFGDGWVAGISVKEVGPKEAATVRRRSLGFHGYDWMIDSIETNRKIISGRPT